MTTPEEIRQQLFLTNPDAATVELTGQSEMSQSGLAALAGVSRQSLIQLEETLVSKAPSKPLEPFLDKALTLVISDSTIQGRPVGNLKIYKASYCWFLAPWCWPPSTPVPDRCLGI